MKELKCRRCKKTVQVEDYYSLKSCPICHEKDCGDSRVRSAERNLDHTSVKLIEGLKFTEPLPKFLQSFTKYQAYWRRYGKEVKASDYFKELEDFKKQEI